MPTTQLHIDVDQIVHTKAPKYYRWLPKWIVRWLARTIHQDELNAILEYMGDKTGVEAAQAALEYLGVSTQCEGLEQVPVDGRYIYVSNHPLGGLDGMALIQLLGQRHQGDIRFLVNDLLMAVKPLASIFLPVNKYGRQSRQAVADIEQEYRGDNQMITFPAGLCSRQFKGGDIADLPWRKFFVKAAIDYRRDIVPVYFDARNSRFFYRLAKWRERLGLKFNVEMIYLPNEMFKLRGSTLRVVVGKPLPWQSLDGSHVATEVDRVRNIVYQLSKTDKSSI